MTLLFSLSWLGENGEHAPRYDQWLDYYVERKSKLNWDQVLIVDDGSPRESLEWWRDRCKNHGQVLSFPHSGRKGVHVYPYIWKAFLVAQALAVSWERIIWIESDFCVRSDRFMDWLNTVEGFAAPWCPSHQIPESGCMVIAGGCGRSTFYNYHVPDASSECRFETAVPFTVVEKSFQGDRFEGDRKPDANDDFISQCSEGIAKALCTIQ